MGLLLYTTEYRNQLSPEYLHSLVDKLPPTIQRKALQYRRWQDSYGCIFGNYLLRIGLKKMKSPTNLSELQYSPERKPFFHGGPHFNISHSANRVVCLLSNERKVGIDIEYIADDISLDDFQMQFTHAEWSAIHSADAPKEKFYQFWTAKESVIKADGRGLGIPLQELDVSKDQTILLDGNAWSLTSLSHFDGYACHFCVGDLPMGDLELPLGDLELPLGDLEFYEIPASALYGQWLEL